MTTPAPMGTHLPGTVVKRYAQRCGVDLLPVLTILGIAAADLTLQEAYHRVSASSVGLVVLAASAVVAALAVALIHAVGSGRAARASRRMVFVLALAVACYWLLGAAIGAQLPAGRRGVLVLAGSGVVAAAAAVALSMRAGDAFWARARLALLAGAALFVCSQPVLGALRAQSMVWPAGFEAGDAAADAGRVITLVLLFDELNARNAGPFVEVLERSGLQVATKAVPSIGDGTANVVPALFTGKLFPDARPCGLNTICNKDQALDFSRVHASRPDIDVVGFYHPYCAITGLRSCARPGIDLAIFDLGRWQCGLWRRFGWPGTANESVCRDSAVGAWGAMRERTLSALRRAQALRKGGVLFAHLPLPHPPGKGSDGSLAQHYDANLQRATALLSELLGSAKSAGLEVRVLLFSDHPLRQAAWCRGYPGFFTGACAPVDRLLDDKVPLIVAGARTPDLSGLDSNLRVFSLPSGWTNRATTRP